MPSFYFHVVGSAGQASSERQAEQSAPVMTACQSEYTFSSAPAPAPPALLPLYLSKMQLCWTLSPSWSTLHLSLQSHSCPLYRPLPLLLHPAIVSFSSSLVTQRWASHPSHTHPVFSHCLAYVSNLKAVPLSPSFPVHLSPPAPLRVHYHHHPPSWVPRLSLPSSLLFLYFSPNEKIHSFWTWESFIFIFLRYKRPVCSLIFSSPLVFLFLIYHLSVSISSSSKFETLSWIKLIPICDVSPDWFTLTCSFGLMLSTSTQQLTFNVR